MRRRVEGLGHGSWSRVCIAIAETLAEQAFTAAQWIVHAARREATLPVTRAVETGRQPGAAHVHPLAPFPLRAVYRGCRTRSAGRSRPRWKMPRSQPPYCPQCQQLDAVRKVSAIYDAETRVVST